MFRAVLNLCFIVKIRYTPVKVGVNPPTPPPQRTGFLASFLILYILYGENLSSGFCEQQGTDQPAHTRSLISAFVITGTVA